MSQEEDAETRRQGDAEDQAPDEDPDVDEDPDDDAEDQDTERPSGGWGPQGEPFFGRGNDTFGILVSVIGLLDVFGTAVWVMMRMGDARLFDLSAVQVTQIYMQGAFWLLVSIGVMAAGLLLVVSTRKRE